MTGIPSILRRAADGERISREEGLELFLDAPTQRLASVADDLRRSRVADPEVVTWQIDRNVNTTNVCMSGCRFCNFHCPPHRDDLAYVISVDECCRKAEETLRMGGDQLLIQGGLHPGLGIDYYENLFRELKGRFPQIRLNALGAPEISHIAKISDLSTKETLKRLHSAGLDTLPGAGAEILSQRVRRIISPAKPTVDEWCHVMREAHELGISSTATMMYGHVETREEIIDHLLLIRSIQDAKPGTSLGFTAFIPWIFRSSGTQLEKMGYTTHFSPTEYLRIIAISRILLDNIPNIQASWLTVGTETAQMALHSGANDFGSIMIEEHVVASAGASNRLDREGIQRAIRQAGFTPRLRNQQYEYRD